MINGKAQRMVTALEFLERLQASATTTKMKERGCNNELEQDHYDLLYEEVKEQMRNQKKLQHTFWEESKSIMRDGKKDPKTFEEKKPCCEHEIKEAVPKDKESKAFSFLLTAKDKVFDSV